MSTDNKTYKRITMPEKTPETVQIRDTFETPRYAVDWLIPFIPKDVECIWECASGSGRIQKVLARSGYEVFPSDIRPMNFDTAEVNFITNQPSTTIQDALDNYKVAVITNPPFSIKEQFIEKAFSLGVPFAFLVNADYHAKSISWVERGCEKIIPDRRVNFITPNVVIRVNESLNTEYKTVDEIPSEILFKFSSSQFHSMWLTYGFGLGKTETFIKTDLSYMKRNML